MRSIKKALGRNVCTDRTVTRSPRRQDARERVLAHEEQLKDDHRQAEAVVFGQAVDLGEITVLQLGRLIIGHADIAAEDPPVDRKLKAVAIDETRGRVAADDDVVGVHVADHDVALMQHGERAREIARRMDQKRPVCLGEEFLAAARPQEFVERTLRGHQRHGETHGRRPRIEHVGRPGGNSAQRIVGYGDHRFEFGHLAGFERLGIDLRDAGGPLVDSKHRTLAAGTQLLAQADDAAVVDAQRLGRHAEIRQPTARALSSSVRSLIAGELR